MTPVWININTNVAHRDPGCTRIVRTPERDLVCMASRPWDCKPCFYCHSAAGHRRYP